MKLLASKPYPGLGEGVAQTVAVLEKEYRLLAEAVALRTGVALGVFNGGPQMAWINKFLSYNQLAAEVINWVFLLCSKVLTKPGQPSPSVVLVAFTEHDGLPIHFW
jgi:hypothetical protein